MAEFRAHISRNATGEYFVDGGTEIDVATARVMRDAGAPIIDVRDQGSFERGHIPAAHHLDLNVGLSRAALGALVARDEPVIFYCWGKFCPYSAYAAAKAIVWGYSRVYRLPGGLPAWEDADLPTEETVAGRRAGAQPRGARERYTPPNTTGDKGTLVHTPAPSAPAV